MQKNDLNNQHIKTILKNNLENDKMNFGHKFLIGKNDEVLLFVVEDFEKESNDKFACVGNLCKLNVKNNRMYLQKVLRTEFYVDNYYNNPFLYIGLIKIIGDNHHKGYGTMMLDFLENFAYKKGCQSIHGNFIPIYPASREQVKAFYEKNGYSVQFGGKDTMLYKNKLNFHKCNEQTINGFKVIYSRYSNYSKNFQKV